MIQILTLKELQMMLGQMEIMVLMLEVIHKEKIQNQFKILRKKKKLED